MEKFKIPRFTDPSQSYFDGFSSLIQRAESGDLHYVNNPNNDPKLTYIDLRANLVEGMDLELAALRGIPQTNEQEKQEYSYLEKEFTDLRNDFIKYTESKINSVH